MDKARYRIRHEYTTLGAGAAYSRQMGYAWSRHEYTTLGSALHTRARWGDFNYTTKATAGTPTGTQSVVSILEITDYPILISFKQ